MWRGYFPSTAAFVLTPEGGSGTCVNTFTEECQAQVPPTEQEYTVSGKMLSFGTRSRVGITTRKQSAALAPACAKNNIYLIDTSGSVSTSEIISYDSKSGRLSFIDPRRPDEVNCAVVRSRVGEEAPYLEVENIALYQGTIEVVAALGPHFVCEPHPGSCVLEIEAKGVFDATVPYIANLMCVAGDCLNTAGAASPSAAAGPKESPVDV